MTEAQRETFLREHLPEAADYYDLLTDFRHGGFRTACWEIWSVIWTIWRQPGSGSNSDAQQILQLSRR